MAATFLRFFIKGQPPAKRARRSEPGPIFGSKTDVPRFGLFLPKLRYGRLKSKFRSVSRGLPAARIALMSEQSWLRTAYSQRNSACMLPI
jgi:hypothetical protein